MDVFAQCFVCGLCGLLEPTQNREILDGKPQDPAVPQKGLITLSIYYENCLKFISSLLWNLRLFMLGIFSVYTKGSTMRRVMVSGHDNIHYNSNMSTLPSGTLYRGECLPSSE